MSYLNGLMGLKSCINSRRTFHYQKTVFPCGMNSEYTRFHMSLIYFVTSNTGKVKKAKIALKKYGITVKQIKIDLSESRAEDPAMIALEKAREAYKRLKKPVIVEDSGFFIRALGGFPMTHVKFSLRTLGIKYILRAMRGLKDRHAEWRMTVVYVFGPSKFQSFTFIAKGTLALAPRPVKREMMSEYWRLFIPSMLPGNKKALCEMAEEDLQAWNDYGSSHNQFELFGKWLSEKKKK